MNSEDHVFGLLTDANPIPNVDDLDLRVLGGAHYLEALEQKVSQLPELDKRSGRAKNYERQVGSRWLAAALAIIAGTVALILLNQGLKQDPAAPSPPDATDLIGTWDYALDPVQRDLVLQDYKGLVDSASEVVVRVGLDDQEYWQGILFDGELFLGDSGSLEVDDGLLVLTSGQADIRTTYRWSLVEGVVTFTWLEQCWISPDGDDCTGDRLRMENEDPLTIPLWENSFAKISEEASYQLGTQSSPTTLGS